LRAPATSCTETPVKSISCTSALVARATRGASAPRESERARSRARCVPLSRLRQSCITRELLPEMRKIPSISRPATRAPQPSEDERNQSLTHSGSGIGALSARTMHVDERHEPVDDVDSQRDGLDGIELCQDVRIAFDLRHALRCYRRCCRAARDREIDRLLRWLMNATMKNEQHSSRGGAIVAERRRAKHRNTETPKHRNTETPKHRKRLCADLRSLLLSLFFLLLLFALLLACSLLLLLSIHLGLSRSVCLLVLALAIAVRVSVRV